MEEEFYDAVETLDALQLVSLDEELQSVLKPVCDFLDSKFDEATKELSQNGLYDALALGAMTSLKASMSWEAPDLAQATAALEKMQSIAENIRMRQSVVKSLYANLVKGETEWSKSTRLQRHAQICAAEAWLIRATLSILTDPGITVVVKEVWNLRKCYMTYKTAYTDVLSVFKRYKQGEPLEKFLAKYEMDEDLLCAVLFGWGMGQLTLSFVPPTILKVFAAVGICPDVHLGLGLLECASGYPVEKRWTVEKGKWKEMDWPVQIQPIGTNKLLVRQFLARSALVGYHILLPSMFTTLFSSSIIGRRILDTQLAKHPLAFHFNIARARAETSMGHSLKALEIYSGLLENVSLKDGWTTLEQAVNWDQALASICALQFEQAIAYMELLQKDSRWSNVTYHFAIAVLGNDLDKGMALMKDISSTKLTHYGGKSIPLEKFLKRKSRDYIRNGGLVLGAYEFGYFFNVFECMNAEQLGRVLIEIDAASPSNVDEECLTRFLRGVVKRELALPSKDWLHPIQPDGHVGKDGPLVQEAMQEWQWVLHNAANITFDHLYPVLARFEMARTLSRVGKYKDAMQQCELAAVGGFSEKEAKAIGWRVGKFGKVKASQDSWTSVRVHNFQKRLELECDAQK